MPLARIKISLKKRVRLVVRRWEMVCVVIPLLSVMELHCVFELGLWCGCLCCCYCEMLVIGLKRLCEGICTVFVWSVDLFQRQ